MYQLVYLSYSTHKITTDDINQILDVAHLYNPEHGITGMLLYRKGVFLQLLEGDKAEVEALYQKILIDDRHKDVVTIVSNVAGERLFDQWSMAYSEIKEVDLEAFKKSIPWEDLLDKANRNHPVDKKVIMDLLVNFRYKLTS